MQAPAVKAFAASLGKSNFGLWGEFFVEVLPPLPLPPPARCPSALHLLLPANLTPASPPDPAAAALLDDGRAGQGAGDVRR